MILRIRPKYCAFLMDASVPFQIYTPTGQGGLIARRIFLQV
jgi:hypothetical protein